MKTPENASASSPTLSYKMTALFSCAAYHRYEELVEARKKLATAINTALADKVYGPIHFLVVQFSALTLVNPVPPEIEDENTLMMIVDVHDTSPAHLSSALMQGLSGEVVPNDLRADLQEVLTREGWL